MKTTKNADPRDGMGQDPRAKRIEGPEPKRALFKLLIDAVKAKGKGKSAEVPKAKRIEGSDAAELLRRMLDDAKARDDVALGVVHRIVFGGLSVEECLRILREHYAKSRGVDVALLDVDDSVTRRFDKTLARLADTERVESGRATIGTTKELRALLLDVRREDCYESVQRHLHGAEDELSKLLDGAPLYDDLDVEGPPPEF